MLFPANQLAVVIEIQIEANMSLAVIGIDTDLNIVAMVLGHVVVANIDAPRTVRPPGVRSQSCKKTA